MESGWSALTGNRKPQRGNIVKTKETPPMAHTALTGKSGVSRNEENIGKDPRNNLGFAKRTLEMQR